MRSAHILFRQERIVFAEKNVDSGGGVVTRTCALTQSRGRFDVMRIRFYIGKYFISKRMKFTGTLRRAWSPYRRLLPNDDINSALGYNSRHGVGLIYDMQTHMICVLDIDICWGLPSG